MNLTESPPVSLSTASSAAGTDKADKFLVAIAIPRSFRRGYSWRVCFCPPPRGLCLDCAPRSRRENLKQGETERGGRERREREERERGERERRDSEREEREEREREICRTMHDARNVICCFRALFFGNPVLLTISKKYTRHLKLCSLCTLVHLIDRKQHWHKFLYEGRTLENANFCKMNNHHHQGDTGTQKVAVCQGSIMELSTTCWHSRHQSGQAARSRSPRGTCRALPTHQRSCQDRSNPCSVTVLTRALSVVCVCA